MIVKHGNQRRRQREGKAEVYSLFNQFLKGPEQGNITFCDGLKEPTFLHDPRLFRVTDIGQVRVQDQRKIACGHKTYPLKEKSILSSSMVEMTVKKTQYRCAL